jgi:E3 ubiquitin-protein ligase MARCH6
MFHFALFVSMARKIMRKGVLYFIRDPDDPEFHPVRDVLERNVTTQLRKILFSAFVYGALVIICLGGVVWGLALALPSVFPVHYSSNEPVLEFPIDLLFYNFLMPLAVKFFRPSDGLHAMYTWWFRKCARTLRITWFLFGERRIDEEGTIQLSRDSEHHKLTWWRKAVLELGPTGNEIVPKRWQDSFEGGTAKPTSGIQIDDLITMNHHKITLTKTGQLIPDGRFVRTPASDQVKIPKGRAVFLNVTEANTRQDGRADRSDTDIYSTEQYQFVYIPPYFRLRIFLFILFIWIFAAITGVGITIVPLVFGRCMFKLLIPAHIRTNDIYAFSIGIYLLGSTLYVLLHARRLVEGTSAWLSHAYQNVVANHQEAFRRVRLAAWRVTKFVYAYFFLLVVFPLLVAVLMELYALIPIHTWMYSTLLQNTTGVVASGGADEIHTTKAIVELTPPHSIRVIQAWTIGLLYLKLSARIVTIWFDGTRLAAAVRAVLRRGWLDPDARVLTRAFIVPGLLIWTTAVVAPLLFAKMTVAHGLADAIIAATSTSPIPGIEDPAIAARLAPSLRDAYLVLIYRLSFPVMAVAMATVLTVWSMVGIFRTWKVRIRDEAYLIGERLHNFGVGTNTAVLSRARGALRAGQAAGGPVGGGLRAQHE